MKISVVTISFNQAKYLRQCIDSVLNQSHVDVEYIIVDPGSLDGSKEIIQSYGDKIVRIFDPDNGPADGLNKGFERATGDIFYFINSDDFVYPEAFKEIVSIFSKSPLLDIVLAGGDEVDKNGEFVRRFYPSKVSPEAYVNGAVTLFQQGMFFRRSIYLKAGGFNIQNRTCWDGELLLNFSMCNPVVSRLMKAVAAFRIYPESITGSQRFYLQYKLDQERMFSLVYGESILNRSVLKFWYRLKKILFDPFYLYKRIFG